MRLALLQINPTAGDLDGNSALIIRAARAAQAQGADLMVTPELALMGYLPRDLLMNQGFVRRGCEKLSQHRRGTEGRSAAAGGRGNAESRRTWGARLYNSAVLLHDGAVGQAFHKSLLPTYDVFDEDRYFEPYHGPQLLELNGVRLGISICEDVWNDRDFWKRRRYHQDPIEALAKAGAQAIVNLSASPFTVGKQTLREEMLGHMARKYGLPVAIVNQVGANDDLIFDGRSGAFDAQGKLFARAKGFEEDVLIGGSAGRDGRRSRATISRPRPKSGTRWCSGVRDYARKTRFRKVLLGLSGGIDSALTAAIAADAMGPENVLGVMMPSRYSSQGSVDDSVELARNLGIQTMLLPISDIMKTYDGVLADAFAGLKPDVTEENIQSRIRGNLLMALSNKFGSLLLTTGNKSEMSVGYCTLYGDMNGGLAVIADLPKMMVYRVSRWRNQRGAGDSGIDAHQGAFGRAAAGPDRPGQPAALRAAGRDSGTARGAVPQRRGDHRARL